MDAIDYMQRALEISLNGNPFPNPYVGAVIVKADKIIAEGFHRQAGMPHAEIEALSNCKDPKDSIMYVTLEPCSHHGRTPPCTDAIINAGIKKVVYGLDDPNPEVSGGKILKEAGISVESGILEEEVRKVNEVFIKQVTTGLPFITLKSGMTLDGKIATRSGQSKWITSEESREIAHHLRNINDAILVGINTVNTDDPSLTCRIEGGRDPLRIIIDSRLSISLDAKVLADENVIIITSEKHDKKKHCQLEDKARIWVLGKEKVDLEKLVAKLGKEGISSVLVEGGSQVNSSFIKDNLIDKIILFIAPKIFSGRDTAVFGGKGIDSITDALDMRIDTVEAIGEDLMLTVYPQH